MKSAEREASKTKSYESVEPELASALSPRHLTSMKSATAEQVQQHWVQILEWVASGEEVQIIQQDKIVARVMPPSPVSNPDFLARAKSVWGETPAGTPLSQVVSESRGS
jgi:antitoxin (DNA-binding transcriptional repressor) of toxin-antitoxin stability system